ncbi:DUF1349 domain-containing protein [Streptomyces microflavus]|uniref:DUF1349 domain-containing protein n=1 Tax=Streptomyces microflavus TaxID=1919 RepID=A0A7H8MJ52_STRMI|nr:MULTISPECIES: DUF1349 domain-containing protein [Streptomyces]MBK5992041.1 DUF1349 domain-containing protein [Streptomyces sp. MBT58]MBW3357911.1 DUF1349 domain-containing protein [Streptomyces sp. 09ZI22]MEE1733268.1 DUF1349 domain-containing protein [Streptomyces sp. BE282]QKW42306.1 DUF1349 domain-containing protein [Streptomyces microflavus]QTA31214.1 hypothetical protein JHY03_13450 [Streptomyces sp. CA-256286]
MTLHLDALPFALAPEGPDGRWTHADGILTGRAGPGQDLFVPPSGEALDSATDAPRLLGAVGDGDFRLLARVRPGLVAAGDAGALHLHLGDRDWAKLCLEHSSGLATICSVVTRGHSDDANAFVVEEGVCWLRLSRTGSAYAFHASADGETWTFVRVFTLGTAAERAAARAGFLVQSPTGEGCGAVFDRIAFLAGGVEDLRDGR